LHSIFDKERLIQGKISRPDGGYQSRNVPIQPPIDDRKAWTELFPPAWAGVFGGRWMRSYSAVGLGVFELNFGVDNWGKKAYYIAMIEVKRSTIHGGKQAG